MIIFEKQKSFELVLWRSGWKMLLCLQPAYAGDLPVKIKRGFKNVDVYNTNAKLIIYSYRTTEIVADPSPVAHLANFSRSEELGKVQWNTIVQALFGEKRLDSTKHKF